MCFLLGEHADTDQSSHAAVWEPLHGVLGVSDGALPAEGNLLLVCIHSSGKTLALVTCVVPNQKLWDPEYSNIWNCLSGSMMPQWKFCTWSDMMCYSKNVSALKTHMWSTDEPCLGLDPVPNICMCLCSWACPHRPHLPFIPDLQFCFLWNDLITLARIAVYDEWEVKSFSRFRVLTFSFSFFFILWWEKQELFLLPLEPGWLLPGWCSPREGNVQWQDAALSEYENWTRRLPSLPCWG